MSNNFLIGLVPKVVQIYQDIYPEIKSKEAEIMTVIQNEGEKFEKTLAKGLKQFEKISLKGNISGIDAFHLYDTYGFPLELTIELAEQKDLKVDKQGFENAFKKHQQISRAGIEKKFGGIGKQAGDEAIKLHTATHLLHQALREILGEEVSQMGSDITAERLRFDFSHSKKMTETEIKKVGDWYYLVTKHRYEKPDRAGTDGYLAKQEIIKLGAKYKAPAGYESFGREPFHDAYGKKFDD